MATLEQILAGTLLVQSIQASGSDVDRWDKPEQVPPDELFLKPSSSDSWSWAKWSVKPDAISVSNLRHSYDKHKALVCESITWDPVILNVRSREYKLSYGAHNLLAARFLKNGRFGENHDGSFWRLGAEITGSVLLVFGYALDTTTGKVDKISSKIAKSPLLMPDKLTAHSNPADELAPTGITNVGVAPRPRAIVCVSLTCCKPKGDWDPGGAVSVARLYPHIMVMTNFDLTCDEEIKSSIHLERPKATTPSGHHDESGQMNNDIRFLLVTDSNSVQNKEGFEKSTKFQLSNWKPDLEWDIIFDYLDDAPSPGQVFVMVDPDDPRTASPRRVSKSGCVTYRNGRGDRPWKLARQAEFDNLHMAPTMRNSHIPREPKSFDDHEKVDYFKKLKMDDVVMAPVCAHDCLHMHWRWGDPFTQKWVRGWGQNGPHTVAGAPMVPMNQKVSIKLTQSDNPSVEVITEIKTRVHAGEWQVILPQGAGYAVDTNIKGDLAAFGKSWWRFYWDLRYVPENAPPTLFLPETMTGCHERIVIKDITTLRSS